MSTWNVRTKRYKIDSGRDKSNFFTAVQYFTFWLMYFQIIYLKLTFSVIFPSKYSSCKRNVAEIGLILRKDID